LRVSVPPFQSFFESHRADVYRYLVVAVGAQEADDCLQDTFIAALRAYPGVRPASNLKAWVLAIAHNKAIDHHRAAKRRPQPTDQPEPEPAVWPAREHATTWYRAHVGGWGDLWDSVRRLPPKQMAAVVLRYVNDLAYRDIAHTMECTEAAARQNVHEALKNLRQELRDETA
jgi:RNA polymerase sigma factor (sigma-70 family)